jgi:hypothetical protein
MKLTTDLNDRIKLENTVKKAERLCKLHKCSMIDLIVISIDAQAEIKNSTKLN